MCFSFIFFFVSAEEAETFSLTVAEKASVLLFYLYLCMHGELMFSP